MECLCILRRLLPAISEIFQWGNITDESVTKILDLFVFIGEPKDILDEYTQCDRKSQYASAWSFGFWMSRITTFRRGWREVADALRVNKIPCDVIHFEPVG
jgi:alpha-glucosidase (family GH31 glycosyl hydrolase)